MKQENLLKEIENIFLGLGFTSITIKKDKYFMYNNCFCKLTFLKKWSAFVIEYTDNIIDAEKGILEDGDLYYVDVGEQELLSQIRNDLIKYYMAG